MPGKRGRRQAVPRPPCELHLDPLPQLSACRARIVEWLWDGWLALGRRADVRDHSAPADGASSVSDLRPGQVNLNRVALRDAFG